jgi:hypothetical protein
VQTTPLVLQTKLGPQAVAAKVAHTAWVVQYETSLFNLFDFFSYKTAERVVDFKPVQLGPASYQLTAAAQTWGQKAADYGWRAPVVHLEATQGADYTNIAIRFAYDTRPYRTLALWGAVWVLVLAFALYSYDLNYGFGFFTAVALGVGGLALVLATLASVQNNWRQIEKNLTLLLRDSFNDAA